MTDFVTHAMSDLDFMNKQCLLAGRPDGPRTCQGCLRASIDHSQVRLAVASKFG